MTHERVPQPTPDYIVTYYYGWDKNGEWTCPKCGTHIGKNLLGDKPYALARQHVEKCYGIA